MADNLLQKPLAVRLIRFRQGHWVIGLIGRQKGRKQDSDRKKGWKRLK